MPFDCACWSCFCCFPTCPPPCFGCEIFSGGCCPCGEPSPCLGLPCCCIPCLLDRNHTSGNSHQKKYVPLDITLELDKPHKRQQSSHSFRWCHQGMRRENWLRGIHWSRPHRSLFVSFKRSSTPYDFCQFTCKDSRKNCALNDLQDWQHVRKLFDSCWVNDNQSRIYWLDWSPWAFPFFLIPVVLKVHTFWSQCAIRQSKGLFLPLVLASQGKIGFRIHMMQISIHQVSEAIQTTSMHVFLILFVNLVESTNGWL